MVLIDIHYIYYIIFHIYIVYIFPTAGSTFISVESIIICSRNTLFLLQVNDEQVLGKITVVALFERLVKILSI